MEPHPQFAKQIDQLIADAWPPEVSVAVGSSRLRWCHGVTRRANSVLVVDPDDPVGLIAAADAFYSGYGATPTFMLSDASAPRSMFELLSDRGSKPHAETSVLHARIDDALIHLDKRPTNSGWSISVAEHPTDAWFGVYWGVEGHVPPTVEEARLYRRSLLAASGSLFVSVVDGATTIGVGQLVIDQDWAGIQCLATSSERRGQGVASTVLRAIAHLADDRGAERLYLAVMDNNPTARRLYDNIGFDLSHHYRYYS